MKRINLLSTFIFFTSIAFSQTVTVVKSPAELPKKEKKLKIFLGGSIDMGNAENWQAKVEQKLSDKKVVLFNPRRDDWNKEWKPISSDTNFRKQVEWELNALEKADIIIMNFAPNSQSPISLLELGLYTKSKKLMVVCPEGYWRKGNVDILCEKYRVKTFATIDDLIEEIKKQVK
jgi:hypothetical protein